MLPEEPIRSLDQELERSGLKPESLKELEGRISPLQQLSKPVVAFPDHPGSI